MLPDHTDQSTRWQHFFTARLPKLSFDPYGTDREWFDSRSRPSRSFPLMYHQSAGALPAVRLRSNNEPDEQTAKDGNHSCKTQIGKRTTILIHKKIG